jgi:hypothetical protein
MIERRGKIAIGIALLVLIGGLVVVSVSPRPREYVSLSFLGNTNDPAAGEAALFVMTNHSEREFTWWTGPGPNTKWLGQTTNQFQPDFTWWPNPDWRSPAPSAGRLKGHGSVTLVASKRGQKFLDCFGVQLVETCRPRWKSYVSEQLRRTGLHCLDGRKQFIRSPEVGG